MRTAVAPGAAFCVLTVLAFAAAAGSADAEGVTERAPSAVAPNLKRRPEPLPPVPQPNRQAPQEKGPSASDEPSPPGHGCPDQGRKLELIV